MQAAQHALAAAMGLGGTALAPLPPGMMPQHLLAQVWQLMNEIACEGMS